MSVSDPSKSSSAIRSLAAHGPNAIFGSGEMADLTRAFDWSTTPVGAIEEWPAALLITVNTLLQSHHPMFLWWGPDLIQFYNDAYRPSIREDKHPRALGQKGRDCWPEIWHIIGPQIDAVMTSGEATWHEDQLVPINRNGKLEDVYWTYGYSPVRNAEGPIGGTLVVCNETTSSVVARKQLKQETERLANLFQQAPAFFAAMHGPEHVFELVNPPYRELIGQRDVLGKSVREAIPEADEQGFITLLDNVYKTGTPYVGRSTPILLARADSKKLEQRYLDFVYQPRRDSQGNITGVIALGVDVTEARMAEQILLRSEKLNAVGRLASSIAHEINNPLAAVTNLLYLAQQAASNPDTQKYLTTAELELKRVSAIANQTLRFHRQTTGPSPVTGSELFEITMPLYQARIGNAQVTVEQRHRSHRAFICFEGEIRQVLSNLVGNAVDAMSGEGGTLRIRSRDATDWKSGRQGVVLTVADTGSGMSAQTMARIFEPFFTTKGHRGNGLGLWISREIIERHRGVVRVRSSQSERGSGTVFALFLPTDDFVLPEKATFDLKSAV